MTRCGHCIANAFPADSPDAVIVEYWEDDRWWGMPICAECAKFLESFIRPARQMPANPTATGMGSGAAYEGTRADGARSEVANDSQVS
ncbi:hypothetical protein FA95DRAFT_1567299 [Auriscalpium vulgare]|uniref:Uncharacterized protein n=1 Tax=Auriscalpium vulgare TaxID=40419 RepID=A0ACB8R5M4_9AGAM|nr:hypothetical protein FA95DRAFT_1567299 [Auriscalpium vulgare]